MIEPATKAQARRAWARSFLALSLGMVARLARRSCKARRVLIAKEGRNGHWNRNVRRKRVYTESTRPRSDRYEQAQRYESCACDDRGSGEEPAGESFRRPAIDGDVRRAESRFQPRAPNWRNPPEEPPRPGETPITPLPATKQLHARENVRATVELLENQLQALTVPMVISDVKTRLSNCGYEGTSFLNDPVCILLACLGRFFKRKCPSPRADCP